MRDTEEPPENTASAEIMAEAHLYGTIYSELTRALFPAKIACERARQAVEDFRESRLMAQKNRPTETRQ